MPHNKISVILAKYGTIETSNWPSSLDEDFKQALKLVPHKPLANALAAAFRANETPSFPSMVVTLYGSSQHARLRYQLLDAILREVPGFGFSISLMERRRRLLRLR